MDKTLELISETQSKLKELIDDYRNESLSIKKENEDRIEKLYSQILDFIAEKFEPYKQFYIRYCNKLHDVASVWIKNGESGDWIDIRATPDWTQFFFAKNYCNLEIPHGRIVLGWSRIKEDFLESLERHKNQYLKILQEQREYSLKLKEQLDAFEL